MRLALEPIDVRSDADADELTDEQIIASHLSAMTARPSTAGMCAPSVRCVQLYVQYAALNAARNLPHVFFYSTFDGETIHGGDVRLCAPSVRCVQL